MYVWLILVAGLVITVGLVGWLGHRRAPALADRLLPPARAAVRVLVDGYRAFPAYLLVLAAGVGLTTAVGLLVGRAAKGFGHFDRQMWPWWIHHQVHSLTPAMKILTQMGDRDETYGLAFCAALLLAVLYPRRRWWVPPLALFSVVVLEHVMQNGMAAIINRGHPPIGNGTYFSGGVARLIAIVGVALLLALRLNARTSRRTTTGLWCLLAALVWVEAYSRLYLGKHFTSDVVGGAVVGTMLLCSIGFALHALLPARSPAGPPPVVDLTEQEPAVLTG